VPAFVTLARSCLGFCLSTVGPNVAHPQLFPSRRESVWTGRKHIFCSRLPSHTPAPTFHASLLPFSPICSRTWCSLVAPLHCDPTAHADYVRLPAAGLPWRSRVLYTTWRFSTYLWIAMCIRAHLAHVAVETSNHSPNVLDTPCMYIIVLIIKPTRCTKFSIFGIKLYMFRTVPLSIISSFSLYTQQWYMSYRFADSLWARSVWIHQHIPLMCVQWKTPDDGQRNCLKHVEFYSKNKFEKLMHLVGFYYKIYHDARSSECQGHKWLYKKYQYAILTQNKSIKNNLHILAKPHKEHTQREHVNLPADIGNFVHCKK